MITAKEVLERIVAAMDEMDFDDLAKLHNETTNYDPITGNDILRPDCSDSRGCGCSRCRDLYGD